MELGLILTKLRPFELSHFRHFLHYRIWSLCNQLLLQFSMDLFENLLTCCEHNKNVNVVFTSDGARINFDRIMAL